MQQQMAAMNQAIQQQALLINKMMLRDRQQSAINGDDHYDDDLLDQDGDIDRMNEETQSFLDEAAPTTLEQRTHAVQSSQH